MKDIERLEKRIDEVESTAEHAESLASDVELDLEALTAKVNSLIAEKEESE